MNTQGEKNGFAKLSLFQATEIKRLARKGILTQKEIALRFNISRHTVQDIKSGKRWKHLV